jgi:predicted Rossmann-fold nucleotide-binding protein
MSYTTEVCIFGPGGFGTLYELFEMLTLQETNKIGKIPIILFGVEYWKTVDHLIKELLLEKFKTVNAYEVSLYTITDDEDQILKIISESRLRDGRDALA